MTKYIPLVLVLMLLSIPLTSACAQEDPIWVDRYDGSGGLHDYAKAATIDNTGAIIVVGKTWSDQGNYDPLTLKYSSDGVLQWSDAHDGGSNADDSAMSVTVSLQGDIYVGCISPSLEGDMDYLLIKYSSGGSIVWTQRYDNGSNDRIAEVATDIFGNVVVAGSSVSGNGWDYTTVKYSSDGTQLWVQRYNGYGGLADYAYALNVDREGNICVTGSSWRRSNFNNIPSIGTVKYNSDGIFQWAAHRWEYSPCAGLDVTSDNTGNVYVVGYEGSFSGYQKTNYVTLKYSPSGAGVWTRLYNGSASSYDYGRNIAVDQNGNVFVTGESYASGSYYDMMTLAYSTGGTTIGSHRYDGPISDNDYASDIVYIEPNRILVIGTSPGDGTSSDIVSILYDGECNISDTWPRRFNSEVNLADRAVAVAADENVAYVTGTSDGGETFFDIVTLKYDVSEPIEAPLIHLKDANDQPIPNESFTLIKLPIDYQDLLAIDPQLTEIPENTHEVTTDGDGNFILPAEIQPGDNILLRKQIFTQTSDRHPDNMPNAYLITIDNGVFGVENSNLYFQEITSEPVQNISLRHTTIAYDLVVSVEWNADLQYLESVRDGMMSASNYLYDVTDGQAMIGNLAIYDGKENWKECDIRIYARNDITPKNSSSPVDGFGQYVSFGKEYVIMTRSWYGNIDSTLHRTYIDGPNYDVNRITDYRTKVHELGHYLFSFLDEYKCATCTPLSCAPVSCPENYSLANFGFMDYQTPFDRSFDPEVVMEPWASEMSSQERYDQLGVDNTLQYKKNDGSCWDQFEDEFEKSYNGIEAAIIKPSERSLPGDEIHLDGPNGYDVDTETEIINVNVGAILNSASQINMSDEGSPLRVAISEQQSGDLLARVDVSRLRDEGLLGDILDEGQTGINVNESEGRMYCLDVKAGDYIMTSTVSKLVSEERLLAGSLIISAKSLSAPSYSSDSTVITVDSLPADILALVRGTISPSTVPSIEIESSVSFSVAPDIFQVADQTSELAGSLLGSILSADFADTVSPGGKIMILDTLSYENTFLASVDYVYVSCPDTVHYEIVEGPNDECIVYLDSASNIQRVLIINSDLPSLSTGLQTDQFRVSRHISIAADGISGQELGMGVVLSYDDSYLPEDAVFGDWESGLQAYIWEEGSPQWIPQICDVDTANNIVIIESGISGIYTVVTAQQEYCMDTDMDDICDSTDNCIGYYNPGQADYDLDQIGDTCDPCNNFAPIIESVTDTVRVNFFDTYAYYPVISDLDDMVHSVTYMEYPHWCWIQNDSVMGPAPDTIFIEPLTVVVQDTCNADTLSFLVAIFLCGNANGDDLLNIGDAVFVINYIFREGPSPVPYQAGDANCDGLVNLGDAVYLINYIFREGLSPCDIDADGEFDC